jgi:RNA polymerase sigma factor (sigma-70 family)
MESFEQLAVQYQPMIHKIINSLNIYKNIDEFYQTGLIALWEAQTSFKEEKGGFSSFAYSTIKGRILNQLTMEKKQEERMVYPEETYWDMVEDHPTDLISEFIMGYGKNLSEKETKWLIKACVNGLSIKEIAKSENVSVSAVKNWRSGARNKLRKDVPFISSNIESRA